jgi:predicted Fe-S protein YdhL (DUF1289 family)
VTLIDRELFRFEEIWAAAGPSARRVQAAAAGPGAAHRRAGGGRGAAAPRHERAAASCLAGEARRARCWERRKREAVPSPCISVCRMDAATGLCEGCFRTLDEIAAWGIGDETRQARAVAATGRRGRAGMKHITFYFDFISPYATSRPRSCRRR